MGRPVLSTKNATSSTSTITTSTATTSTTTTSITATKPKISNWTTISNVCSSNDRRASNPILDLPIIKYNTEIDKCVILTVTTIYSHCTVPYCTALLLCSSNYI